MKIVVDPKRLNALCWNAVLFTPKAGSTGGRALFSVARGIFGIQACDDFVAVSDLAETLEEEDQFGYEFTLSVTDIKKLDVLTRTLTEPVELSICEAQLHVLDDVFETAVPESFWMDIVDLIETEHSAAFYAKDVYLNPERLARVARLKTEGDQPLGLRFELNDSGQEIVRFIYGPTIHGVITSMSEETLRGRGVHTF